MIGKTLGHYRIVDQIGLGGMAAVYKAYDTDTDRYVALKVGIWITCRGFQTNL